MIVISDGRLLHLPNEDETAILCGLPMTTRDLRRRYHDPNHAGMWCPNCLQAAARTGTYLDDPSMRSAHVQSVHRG